MGAWWPSRSSKPVKPSSSAWRVRFPSVSAAVGGMSMTTEDVRRAVPRTDAVLADPRLAAAAGRIGRDRVKRTVIDVLQRVRAGELAPAEAADAAVRALPAAAASPSPV